MSAVHNSRGSRPNHPRATGHAHDWIYRIYFLPRTRLAMLLREKQFLDTPNGRPFTRQGSPVWPRCAIVNPNFRTACHSRMPRARACRTRHLANLNYNKHEEQHAESKYQQRQSTTKVLRQVIYCRCQRQVIYCRCQRQANRDVAGVSGPRRQRAVVRALSRRWGGAHAASARLVKSSGCFLPVTGHG